MAGLDETERDRLDSLSRAFLNEFERELPEQEYSARLEGHFELQIPAAHEEVGPLTVSTGNRGIYLAQPPTRGCGLINDLKGTGSTCTACWARR